MTTPSLQSAVRRAYEVFGAYAAPTQPLDVCTFCCMDEELEREMRAVPLRKLKRLHFYEYSTGAKSVDGQPADEVKYLLPRLLELLAAGEETHHSIELALDRVGRCHAGAFSNEERAVLDAFMLACFDACLRGEWVAEDFWYDLEDPLALLVMADYAGLSLAPLLQHWTEHPSPQSTIRFVESTYWGFWSKHKITNAFATNRPRLQAVFKDWTLSLDTKAAFTMKLLLPHFLDQVEQTPSNTCAPFPVMVDAVFDHLTY
ncbi:MAG: hypothetical protein JF607_04120 [Burkholderiales bacterium]|jgi:hypothetical protein|nr:hypothetical protein [Burkholderiales bacterium]